MLSILFDFPLIKWFDTLSNSMWRMDWAHIPTQFRLSPGDGELGHAWCRGYCELLSVHPRFSTSHVTSSFLKYPNQGIIIRASSSGHPHQGILIRASSSGHPHQGNLIGASSSGHPHRGILIRASSSGHHHQVLERAVSHIHHAQPDNSSGGGGRCRLLEPCVLPITFWQPT
ncbi:hypothetical protein ElyMa_000399600 [Elysia marginata]|uniref:Uncharacterized protein n=1 Tax=Elysia marginata TaxID=1093978 RepID=A0AAV4FJV6_9GAST|nr:hypothetical protein ElyMa_000399600 [Elysia marginata]